jgi:hypothetical protein
MVGRTDWKTPLLVKVLAFMNEICAPVVRVLPGYLLRPRREENSLIFDTHRFGPWRMTSWIRLVAVIRLPIARVVDLLLMIKSLTSLWDIHRQLTTDDNDSKTLLALVY